MRIPLAIVLLALAASPALALPGWDGGWFKSVAGQNIIDAPSFLKDGPIRDFVRDGDVDYGTAYEHDLMWVRQYWIQTAERPYVWISRYASGFGGVDDITYTVDKTAMGVLSGWEHGTNGFYEICKRWTASAISCVEMEWNKANQAEIAPIIIRVVKSMKPAPPGSITGPQ